MNLLFKLDDLVFFFVQKASIIKLSGSALMVSRLEKNFSSEKAFNLVFEEKKPFVEVFSLFALDDYCVFALKLVDEVEKNIFMGE